MPKLKKGIEKQFEANSQVLDNVQSASSFLAATPPQVEKALEELEKRSRICTLGAGPYHLLACVGDPASRVESLPFTFEVSAPS